MRTGFFSLLLAALLVIVLPANAIAAKTIVVDAGHGGSDPGALGVNGLYEKNVNYDIAMRVRDLLTVKGYDVFLTRTDDRFISLADRVTLTNGANADAFVSIHANSHPNNSVSGSLVLYYDSRYPQSDYPASSEMSALTPESQKLASLVLDSVIKETGFADRGIVPSAAYVVRMGRIPSILVETAFLSNKGDAARLADESDRQRLASGIVNGIAAYMPLPSIFPDLADHWAREAVLRLKETGIIEGINNRYEPDRPMTRAEWLTVADRLFGFAQRIRASGSAAGTAPVSPADLPKTHWAYDTFQNAVRLGYINGYEDGTVRPDKPVTRAEVAALLERMTDGTQSKVWSGKADFTDVPLTYWASGPIYRMKQKGILNGIADHVFMPAKSMTRAEMAAMIDRYVALSKRIEEPAKSAETQETAKTPDTAEVRGTVKAVPRKQEPAATAPQ